MLQDQLETAQAAVHTAGVLANEHRSNQCQALQMLCTYEQHVVRKLRQKPVCIAAPGCSLLLVGKLHALPCLANVLMSFLAALGTTC